MYTKKLYIFSLLLLIPFLRITSQPGNLSFNIEAIGGYVSPDIVPFWLRSNQYGSVPLDNASLSMISSARKDYNPNKTNIFDWGASIEGRLNMGHKTTFTLVEGYGKIRISIFEIRAGRTKEVMGMCDTSLSSGSWSISGNAPGIPKVQLSIPEFYVLPWFDELFAIKGQFAHGWLGTVKTAIYRDTSFYRTYLHQKSFYGRVGKPWWNIKLLLGINHQAFYGNPQSYYGSEYTLSPLRSYYYLITGKLYSDENIELYVGNHLGSVDMGFEYAFKRIRLWLYRQNFYDSGALFKLANIQDGLNGISLENKHISNHAFRWKKILFELLYTRNQAGEPWSPPTHDPYEPYYNHGEYIHGWSYNDVGLGTPFITPKAMARKELPSNPDEYFINKILSSALGNQKGFQ